ncbi:MAG TPA: hypothetical protein VJR89_04510 [Polyangiales bacterium]|nr:hypothetical protein [Polyangiales bacterium]
MRNLVDQATQSMESSATLASQGVQATEALAEALTSLLRALPGKLRDIEVPSAKHKLEEIAEQLRAIAERLRRLGTHLSAASVRMNEPALQQSGKLVVEGFHAAANIVGFLRPNDTGLVRFVPGVLSRPVLDGLTTVRVGIEAAGDLARICIGSLPDMAEGLGGIAEDLRRAADLLDATSKTIKDLSALVPI